MASWRLGRWLMVTWLERSIGWIRIEPLIAVILWGGIYPGVKLGLRDIPVLSFTTLRIILAMMVLWLVSRAAEPAAVSLEAPAERRSGADHISSPAHRRSPPDNRWEQCDPLSHCALTDGWMAGAERA